MLTLMIAVAMLTAVLGFEVGCRAQARFERRRQRGLDAYMQARTDERVRTITGQHPGRYR